MIENAPQVSVVMITYGHEKFILEAINGVLIQKYHGSIELIIANDNSPDETDEVVKHFLDGTILPDNITVGYTNHDINKGVMPNFRWALQQAQGKYIALCEGDDYWTDEFKIQKQVDFMEKNLNFSAVVHDRFILNTETEMKQMQEYVGNVFTQCLLFRKKNVPVNMPVHIFNGDTYLQLYLELFGQIGRLPFVGAVYRYSGKGIYSSINQLRKVQHAISTYGEFLKLEPAIKTPYSPRVFGAVKKELIEYNFALFNLEPDSSNRKKAYVEYLRISLKYKKFNITGLKRHGVILINLLKKLK